MVSNGTCTVDKSAVYAKGEKDRAQRQVVHEQTISEM